MNEITTLKNRLLVAMPSLKDPTFNRAVAYIFEHSEVGAMGVIINKPMDISVSNVLEMLEIPVDDPTLSKHKVLQGGPVAQEQGFIIHQEKDIGNGEVTSKKHHIIISASKEDLITIPQNHFGHMMMTLGYSGWEQGQLEEEILNNDWLVVPLDMEIMFRLPYAERWKAAAALIGVDFEKLSTDVGHA